MTMTMSPLMSERQQQPAQGGKPRDTQSGLLAMPTREIQLSPEFVDALRQVAPKPRMHVLRYVLTMAVVVAGLSLAVVPGARHRIASAWHRMWHGEQTAASASPPASAPMQPTVSADTTAAPSAVPSASAIVIPPVVISSAAPDTSASSASKPSKPRKRWQRHSPR